MYEIGNRDFMFFVKLWIQLLIRQLEREEKPEVKADFTIINKPHLDFECVFFKSYTVDINKAVVDNNMAFILSDDKIHIIVKVDYDTIDDNIGYIGTLEVSICKN